MIHIRDTSGVLWAVAPRHVVAVEIEPKSPDAWAVDQSEPSCTVYLTGNRYLIVTKENAVALSEEPGCG